MNINNRNTFRFEPYLFKIHKQTYCLHILVFKEICKTVFIMYTKKQPFTTDYEALGVLKNKPTLTIKCALCKAKTVPDR